MSLFATIAGAASILGLVFAFLAFVQARRASIAAAQARDSVGKLSLAEELELACERADQLAEWIEHGRLPEAAMRANDLMSFLSEIPHRRNPYLSESAKNEMLNQRTQVQIIGTMLREARRRPPSIATQEKMVQTCRRISVALRENLGKIKGERDKGAIS